MENSLFNLPAHENEEDKESRTTCWENLIMDYIQSDCKLPLPFKKTMKTSLLSEYRLRIKLLSSLLLPTFDKERVQELQPSILCYLNFSLFSSNSAPLVLENKVAFQL